MYQRQAKINTLPVANHYQSRCNCELWLYVSVDSYADTHTFPLIKSLLDVLVAVANLGSRLAGGSYYSRLYIEYRDFVNSHKDFAFHLEERNIGNLG